MRQRSDVTPSMPMTTDEEAVRTRLVDAAARCIVRRGDIRFRMAEVADEADVVRSTVYRYYASRDDLLLALLLTRIDRGLTRWIAALRRPQDAATSIRALVLNPVASVDDDPLNRALYAAEDGGLSTVLEHGADAVTDVVTAQVAPLFTQWRDSGQIHADLDLRDTLQWMSATTSFLLTPAWRHRSLPAKRRFVDTYLLRALLTRSA